MKIEDFPLGEDENLITEVEEYVSQIPPVRGGLPKQSEELVTRFHFRIGERLLNESKRCASRDARFDGDLSAYIRDSLCDRNDKFIDQEHAGHLDLAWQQHEAISNFKEIIAHSQEVFNFLDDSCKMVNETRRRDKRQFVKLLQTAKRIYATTDSEEMRKSFRDVFPELGDA